MNPKQPQLPSSSNTYRQILKFDENGIPYYKTLISVPGINAIKEELLRRADAGEKEPVIVVGDLSGMADFNNYYGREIADGAIEKALTVFVKNFSGKCGIAASPSGDEMWGVPHPGSHTKEIIKHLTNIIKKLNNVKHPAGKELLGLNAKFYIGRKRFSDVEKYLKINQKTGEKIPPGRIIVEGKLLNKEKDVIIKLKGVSNEKIIRSKAGRAVQGDGQKKKRSGIKRLFRRAEKAEGQERTASQPAVIRSPEVSYQLQTRKRESGSQHAKRHTIRNYNVLSSLSPADWHRKRIEQDMEKTADILNKSKGLNKNQKRLIADILNGKKGEQIWKKLSLSPSGRIASARLLSGEKDREGILKGLPKEETAVIKDIERNLSRKKSRGMER